MNVVRLSVMLAIATSCSPGEVDPGLLRDAGAPPPATPAVTDDTRLEGCEAFPTLGDFEQKLIVPKCGTAGCHETGGRPFAPDMKGLPIHPRLVNRKVQYSLTTCDKERDLYIDSAGEAERSYLVSKVRDPMPTCGSGRPGGARMPFLAKEPLPDGEIACFVSYVRALMGR
jgi:hypothetical protein